MSNEDENGQDERNPEKSTLDEQRRGSHLAAGLRLLSDLLGNLVEVDITDAPPPPMTEEETGERTNANESGVEQQQREFERNRTTQVRKSPADECLIDTRLTDDELIIIADIPDAKKDDLSLGRNPRTNKLVISKNGTVIGRVVLPWESPETITAWFNNGVLEIRVRSKEP
jgi:HSP20 family molecular chaperone IbpA